MAEVREVKDPFTGQTVQINNDLVRRLRGEYASGPTMPNGEPEFGWRKFGEPSPIQLEAAKEIERLRAALSDARPFVADSGDDEDPDASRSASEVVAEIDRLIPSR